MKVLFGLSQTQKFRQPVVALGVFDGLHLAHRRLLQDAVRFSRQINGKSIVITFSPHPQGEPSLYSLKHRLNLLVELGIDICIVLRFSQRLSRMSAQDFIQKIIVKKVAAKYIYVGKNFRFGRNAEGNTRLLKKLSCLYHFKLKTFEIIKTKKRSISSTYIRRLITRGNLDSARKLLDRPVSILGTVIRGSSLARKWGIPTANIEAHHEVTPPCGIYATRIIFQGKEFKGVCYIGTKPTFKTHDPRPTTHDLKSIEVYIFNFRKNIYGQDLEIQFLKKIRNDRKFNTEARLVKQIKKDIIKVKKLFFSHPPHHYTSA